MPKANTKITFFAGNYQKLAFTITDDDNAGVPLNLTGLNLKWAMSIGTISSYAKTPKLEKSLGSGITVTDAPGGLCEVEIESVDTASGNTNGINPTDYYWELEAEDGASQFEVLAFGEFTILLNVENS